MVTCPNCKKELPDTAVFCDNCGTAIPKTLYCPNCGSQNSADVAFCQNCGYKISEDSVSPGALPQKKQFPKKAVLFAGIGAAAIIIVVVLVSLIFGKAGSAPNYSLYIKDKELFYNNLSKGSSTQVTSRLLDSGVEFGNNYMSAMLIGRYCFLSKDGKTLFYPDKINSNDDGISLYYKDISNLSAEGIKVDSGISLYTVNEKTTLVTYLKGSDKILYQYDIKKGEKQKIAGGVSSFEVSDDGKKIVYFNDEGSIYQQYTDRDKEKIDGSVDGISYITEDCSTVYYIKEDSLYKKTEGKDKEKIASDVSKVLKIYKTGEIYYLKSDTSEIPLMDYVNDDMKEADDSFVMPEKPSYPYWWDYSSDAEYDAAYEKYEEENSKYQEAQNRYWEIQSRNNLRDSLRENSFTLSNNTLYFYNGEESKAITDAFADFISAADVPVIIYSVYNQSSLDKVKISEIDSYYDVKDKVQSALYSSSKRNISIKDSADEIDRDKITYLHINPNGKTVYYFDNISDGNDYGDLYVMSISGGKLSEAELYDSDVYTGYLSANFSDGTIVYFKDYKDGKGDLYINKNEIDYDVYAYRIYYSEDQEQFVYFTDWNSDKNYGTLKEYKGGKAVKIADDANEFSVLPNGEVLYLYDYSQSYFKGELYRFKNGKAEKIDDDVYGVFSFDDRKYRGLRY